MSFSPAPAVSCEKHPADPGGEGAFGVLASKKRIHGLVITILLGAGSPLLGAGGQAYVPGRLLVGGHERARRRRRGLGQRTFAATALPELGRAQLAAVLELLLAEADGEGHDEDVVLLDELIAQITGAVGDDVDAGHPASLPRAGRV